MQPIVDKAYCLPHEQVFFLEEKVMSLSGGAQSVYTLRSRPSCTAKLLVLALHPVHHP